MKVNIKFKIILLMIMLLFLPIFSISGNDALARFQGRMRSISTMQGVITINYTSGAIATASFKYKNPGKIYVKFTNPASKTIVSNGKKLWIYDASTAICGIQQVGGGMSGGIASFVSGYMAISTPMGSSTVIKLKSPGRTYSEVTLLVDSTYMLKKATFKNKNGDGFSVSINGLRLNENLHSGLFDFKVPSNAQSINDPLNIR